MNSTHDYTTRYWGHDYTIINYIDDGQFLSVMGWGRGIKKDDFLILRNGNGGTRYKVNRINYKADPKDMWDAYLSFAPRTQVVEV